MRKSLLSIGLGLATCISALAASFSVTVLPGSMTNVMSFSPNQGATLIRQFSLTSLGAGASSCSIIDTPTNQLVYTQPAYTNTISYVTNGILVWTNFYGVLQSNNYVGGTLLTNYWLVDITNHLVAATTNTYPVRVAMAAAGNSTVIYGPLGGNVNGYYFDYGIWATNTSAGTNVITITY